MRKKKSYHDKTSDCDNNEDPLHHYNITRYDIASVESHVSKGCHDDRTLIAIELWIGRTNDCDRVMDPTDCRLQ